MLAASSQDWNVFKQIFTEHWDGFTHVYPRLPPRARPIAAAMFRQTRRRLAYVRQQEQALPPRRSFREEMVARTCMQLRRETRLQLQAMRQLLHALFG